MLICCPGRTSGQPPAERRGEGAENMVFIQQSESVMVKINVTLKSCPVPAINCVCGEGLGPEEQVQGVLGCNESSHKDRSTGVCVCVFLVKRKNVCDVMGADLSWR